MIITHTLDCYDDTLLLLTVIIDCVITHCKTVCPKLYCAYMFSVCRQSWNLNLQAHNWPEGLAMLKDIDVVPSLSTPTPNPWSMLLTRLVIEWPPQHNPSQLTEQNVIGSWCARDPVELLPWHTGSEVRGHIPQRLQQQPHRISRPVLAAMETSSDCGIAVPVPRRKGYRGEERWEGEEERRRGGRKNRGERSCMCIL